MSPGGRRRSRLTARHDCHWCQSAVALVVTRGSTWQCAPKHCPVQPDSAICCPGTVSVPTGATNLDRCCEQTITCPPAFVRQCSSVCSPRAHESRWEIGRAHV